VVALLLANPRERKPGQPHPAVVIQLSPKHKPVDGRAVGESARSLVGRDAEPWDLLYVESRRMLRVVELRPPSYFALAALIDGPLHGYAIAQRARELSGGRVRLSTGTLYALLERALAEALVTAGEPYVRDGRHRRDYALTAAGRDVLEQEAERLRQAARTVSSRLRATSGVVTT